MAVNSALADLLTQAPEKEPTKVPQRHVQKEQSPKRNVPNGTLSNGKTSKSEKTAVAPTPASSSSAPRWFPFRCFRLGSSKEKPPHQAKLVSVTPCEPLQAPQGWEPVKRPSAQKETEEESSSGGSGSKWEEKGSGLSGRSTSASSSSAQPATTQREDKVDLLVGPTPVREKEKRISRSGEVDQASRHNQLGPQAGPNIGRKTLVLDLDETLVHSSFRAVASADIVIDVEIEAELHKVYVRKRPCCDEFLLESSKLYEIVVYTASMSKYASPLLDKLDIHGVCHWRLYREACTKLSGGYAKDLARLGRDLKNVIIIDNSPVCYSLQPDNAIPIQTWRDDPDDRELLDLIPILQSLSDVDDIPQVLRQIIWTPDDDVLPERDEGEQSGSSHSKST